MTVVFFFKYYINICSVIIIEIILWNSPYKRDSCYETSKQTLCHCLSLCTTKITVHAKARSEVGLYVLDSSILVTSLILNFKTVSNGSLWDNGVSARHYDLLMALVYRESMLTTMPLLKVTISQRFPHL